MSNVEKHTPEFILDSGWVFQVKNEDVSDNEHEVGKEDKFHGHYVFQKVIQLAQDWRKRSIEVSNGGKKL